MSIDTFEVVKKLIGRIDPEADTTIDSIRGESLGEFIKLYQAMGDELRRIGNDTSRFASAQEIHERARKACIAEASEILDMDCVPYGATKAFEIGMKRYAAKDTATKEEALWSIIKAIEGIKNPEDSKHIFEREPLVVITAAAQQLWEE